MRGTVSDDSVSMALRKTISDKAHSLVADLFRTHHHHHDDDYDHDHDHDYDYHCDRPLKMSAPKSLAIIIGAGPTSGAGVARGQCPASPSPMPHLTQLQSSPAKATWPSPSSPATPPTSKSCATTCAPPSRTAHSTLSPPTPRPPPSARPFKPSPLTPTSKI